VGGGRRVDEGWGERVDKRVAWFGYQVLVGVVCMCGFDELLRTACTDS